MAADLGLIPHTLVREFCEACELTPGKVAEIRRTAGHYPGARLEFRGDIIEIVGE